MNQSLSHERGSEQSERADERVAQYLRLVFWLIWPTVRSRASFTRCRCCHHQSGDFFGLITLGVVPIPELLHGGRCCVGVDRCCSGGFRSSSSIRNGSSSISGVLATAEVSSETLHGRAMELDGRRRRQTQEQITMINRRTRLKGRRGICQEREQGRIHGTRCA